MRSEVRSRSLIGDPFVVPWAKLQKSPVVVKVRIESLKWFHRSKVGRRARKQVLLQTLGMVGHAFWDVRPRERGESLQCPQSPPVHCTSLLVENERSMISCALPLLLNSRRRNRPKRISQASFGRVALAFESLGTARTDRAPPSASARVAATTSQPNQNNSDSPDINNPPRGLLHHS